MKRSNIFLVRVLFLEEDGEIKRDRIWGYYDDFETAEKCVLENWTDLYEIGYYGHAVIQEMPEGVCVSASNEWWYEVEYEEIPVPADYNPKVTLIHTTNDRIGRKEDPINKNKKGMGNIFLGW